MLLSADKVSILAVDELYTSCNPKSDWSIPLALLARSTNDDITHIIHISKKLPPLEESVELQDSEEAESSR